MLEKLVQKLVFTPVVKMECFNEYEWISTKSAWNLALDMNHKYETGWKYEIKYSNDIQAQRVGQPILGKNKVNKHFI